MPAETKPPIVKNLEYTCLHGIRRGVKQVVFAADLSFLTFENKKAKFIETIGTRRLYSTVWSPKVDHLLVDLEAATLHKSDNPYV